MIQTLPLTLRARGDTIAQSDHGGLCMRGGIYPRGRCPVCAGPFQNTGSDLICPTHLTRPRSLYIQVYSRELHKSVNICSDARGNPFRSYEHADRILTKIRVEIDAGSFDATRYVAQHLKPLRWSNWSASWLEKRRIEASKGFRAPSYYKTLKIYCQKYDRHFQAVDIRDIGTRQVEEFYLSLDGSPKYVKNLLDGLRAMLSDALDYGDIQTLPKFPKIEVPDPDIRTIDLDQQDAVIAAIRDQMDRAFVLFTAREMTRPSETRALQWQDVDLRHDRITIRRHFSLNQLRPATKAKQIKHLPLDGEVRSALLSLPRHLTSPFVFWKGKTGRPFSESWARKLWRRTAGGLGIDVSFYQGTRHSSATEAVERVGVDQVQEFLHHTNRAMTKRYAKVTTEGLRKVLRKAR